MLLHIVKDFDNEVIYYPDKVNVIGYSFSSKLASEPLRELCLRRTMFTPLLELLEKVHELTFSDENTKCKRVSCEIPTVDRDSRGYLTYYDQVCVPTLEVTKRHLH